MVYHAQSGIAVNAGVDATTRRRREVATKMTITNTLIETVADVKGKEPEDLDIVLEDQISMVAIQGLDDHKADSWVLQFELPEHTVRVVGDGTVYVEPKQKRKPA